MPSSSLLAALLKKTLTSCSLKPHTNLILSRIRPFSSQTSATHKRWSYFSDDLLETESSVYNHALKFQRPSTIKYGQYSVKNHGLKFNWPSCTQYKVPPVNSVSFIGTISRELIRINIPDRFGFHTLLKVKASPQSKGSFLVLLKMWNEMAEVAINHLKPNDFVYVSGHLGSYMKTDKDDKLRICYVVIVKEINYVAQNAEKPKYQEPERLGQQDEDYKGRYRNRLHLWQVFFANPYEWKDFRKTKTNPNHPDFKHVNTGEVLWLRGSDPPWIKRQLELLDSELGRRRLGEGHNSSTSCTSLLANDSIQEIGERCRETEMMYGA